MARIQATERLSLAEDELVFEAMRASGPGGQNVNKVETAVELRFDLARSPSLPDGVKDRLARLAGRRLTEGGVLILQARRFRSQERNRVDAVERLLELIRAAEAPPKPRRPTRPTRASEVRRREAKGKRGDVKRLRGRVEE